MANNHTNLQARSAEGHVTTLQHTSTDSPILPAENLRQLQAIDPQLVGWVVAQTEIESTNRRREESKINWFILIERLSGVFFGAIVAMFGLASGAYVILQGHDWAGVGICGVGLATIVSVLVTKRSGKPKEPTAQIPAKRAPRAKKPAR